MEENKSLGNGLGFLGIPSKYILRKTGEEVEIIDSYQEERGARSDHDWATYIDSNGEEHIKENLNLSLDFKASAELSQKFDSLFKPLPELKLPSEWAARKYEIVKTIYIDKGKPLAVAIAKANSLIEALKREPEFQVQEEEHGQ